MELIRETLPTYSISNYTSEEVMINNNSMQKHISLPLFIGGSYIHQMATLQDVQQYITISGIDILIIGSSSSLHPKDYVNLHQIIECEAMNITAAIYSYNILIADLRNAGILLLNS